MAPLPGYYEPTDEPMDTGVIVSLMLTFLNFITLLAVMIHYTTEMNALEQRVSSLESYTEEEDEEQVEENIKEE